MVVGLGEIERPLFELPRESGEFDVYGFDVDQAKMRKVGQDGLPSEIGGIHVCIPCGSQNKFVDTVAGHVKKTKPKLVTIHSTVPLGTTQKVFQRCNCLVHSPVCSVHKSLEHMRWKLKRWTKYVGGVNVEATKTAREHLQKLG